AGQRGRRPGCQPVGELNDADVTAGRDDPVQPALQADLAHQVARADDLPGAAQAAAARMDGRDPGDDAAPVRECATEVADRRLNDAGDGAVGGVDVADDEV